jgi:hypothetical protein
MSSLNGPTSVAADLSEGFRRLHKSGSFSFWGFILIYASAIVEAGVMISFGVDEPNLFFNSFESSFASSTLAKKSQMSALTTRSVISFQSVAEFPLDDLSSPLDRSKMVLERSRAVDTSRKCS